MTKVPLPVAVVLALVALVLVVWAGFKFLGPRPQGTFEEFRQQSVQGGGPPGGLMPAPRRPEERRQLGAGP